MNGELVWRDEAGYEEARLQKAELLCAARGAGPGLFGAITRLQEIRARRGPDGRFCSYLIADEATLNAEPARRPAQSLQRHV